LNYEIRNLSKKWFATATPVNYKPNAVFLIKAGTSGTITLTHDNMTTTDTVAIVLPGTTSALGVTYNSGVITISLANTNGVATDVANTLALIRTALNAVSGKKWTASVTGTGSISSAATATAFTNGQYGTPCPAAGICLFDSANSIYYVCTKANKTNKNNGWCTFQLTNY